MNKFVVKIISFDGKKSRCGTGFIVGDFLITAGHVIKPNAIRNSMIFNGDWVLLPPPIKGPMLRNGFWNIPDLVVFKVDGVNSPLRLSNALVDINMELRSQCYQITENNASFLECPVKVSDIEPNFHMYFAGIPAKTVFPTSSGSPLLINDNDVIGMLVAGPPADAEPENKEKRIFLSSKVIQEIIVS